MIPLRSPEVAFRFNDQLRLNDVETGHAIQGTLDEDALLSSYCRNSYMTTSIVIGCGYLGLRVAKLWRDAGHDVIVLTRSDERAAELAALGLKPVVGDVTRRESLLALPQSDVVLHAVGFDRSAQPSKREVYVDGLRHVLDALATRCRRFVHVSSTSVYAQQAEEWVDENSPLEPTDESGCICLAAEQLIQQAAASNPTVAFNILRLSGIYGPLRLLSRIEAIRSGASLPGPRDSWLNLIHVDDAARTVVACAERGAAGATYLVSDDRPIRRHEYYEHLARLLNAPAPTFDDTAIARHTKGRGKRCCNRKLREELKVELHYPTIETGLPQALQ